MLEYCDWLKTQIKYQDCKCGVGGCHEQGLYEGGDMRCWFPICEEHGELRKRYLQFTQKSELYNKLEKRLSEVLNGTN